jgi:hypothetical protein
MIHNIHYLNLDSILLDHMSDVKKSSIVYESDWLAVYEDLQEINSSSATTTKLEQDQLLLRINGTPPDIKTLGNEEKSERDAFNHFSKIVR